MLLGPTVSVAALLLLACASPPPAADPAFLSGGLPPEWIWVTDSSALFEAAFPAVPAWFDMAESALTPDGEPIRSTRWQAFVGNGAFVLYRTPEPAGAVAANGGSARFVQLIGRTFTQKLGAQLANPRSWEAMEGGWASQLKVGEQEGELRIGLDGDALYVVEAIGGPPAATAAFVEAVSLLEAVTPVRVALPGGRHVECPSRCGPLQERLVVGPTPIPIAGVHGQLDHNSFEAVSIPVGDLDPEAVIDALRARVIADGAKPLRESPIEDGVEVRFTVRMGAGVVRIVERDGVVTATEVIAPFGELPAWSEAFLGSAR